MLLALSRRPDRAGKGHDLYPGAKRRRCRMRGSSCRVDVVYEQNRALERPAGKGAGNIPAPLDEREPALPARPADPREQGIAWQLPRIGKRTGELLGRVIAA